VWESPAIFVPPYAKGTRANEVAWFAATHLVQSVDVFAGEPLILERWQLRFLSEALAQDADGTPYWDTVVLVVSRKNGKTALLAAYSLFQLFDEGSPEILMAASSDKQAGRLFDADLAYVNRSPWLSEQLHQRSYIGEIARVDGLGKIVRMASDPKSAHGYNPSLVICDELHAWITPTLKKAWAAFITGGGARQNTQIFAITTAGEALEREHGILGRLIDGNEQRGECEREPGLTISRNHVARTLVYNYSAPTTDPFDLDAIKLANPASWITLDYLKKQSESPELSEAEFLQLHGCVWAEGEDQWIKEDAWNDLLEEGVEIPAGSDIYVGVDASISEDCTAVAWAWARPDGTVVIDAHVWSARNDVAYDTLVKDGDIDPKLVEDYIADVLAAKFRVREVVYDPALFTRSAKELGKRFVVAPISQQSANMAEAYQGWFSAVYSSQRLAHAGGDTLRRHVTNAIAEMTDRGWRVRKSKQNKKIDALVAGVMAHWRAAVHGPKPSVYERRGVLEFAWEEDDDDEI
jgi:phage terminase large subunit-like protein